jgi:hypothetical protein
MVKKLHTAHFLAANAFPSSDAFSEGEDLGRRVWQPDQPQATERSRKVWGFSQRNNAAAMKIVMKAAIKIAKFAVCKERPKISIGSETPKPIGSAARLGSVKIKIV